MNDDAADQRKWAGVVTTIRVSKRPKMAQRLYMAFAMAMNEAHTRGRIYSTLGEVATPGDEFNATQAACERIFFRELRKKEAP